MKKLFTLIIVALLGTNVALAQATSGTTGDCTWSYNNSTGRLTISGSGAMANTSSSSSVWADYVITSVIIGDSVTSIGKDAFSECLRLQSVTIGKSVSSIGDYAFYNCKGLASVTIPNSVTSIGESAFHSCSGLTDVTISTRVTSIGNFAFASCSGLTSVDIPNSVTSIGNFAFDSCSGLISVTIGNSVSSIGNYAFYGCSGLTSVTIPNSVTSIGNFAFSCSGLTSVTIPTDVTSIGISAFAVCKGLKSVTILNSMTSIGEGLFFECAGLTSVTIPAGVTSIGKDAFGSCSSLTSVTIPNLVTSIGERAFSGCKGLTEIHSQKSTPPMVQSNDAFSGILASCALYVPRGSVEAYKNAYGWKEFVDILQEGDVLRPITGITLNKTTTTLAVDSTEQLTATVQPTNATIKTVTWSSSNPSIATVSTSGLVTAKAAGTATITGTTANGGKTATCKVTVTNLVASLTLNKTTTTLAIGNSETLTTTILPTDATNKAVMWSSSNANIATVNKNGVVTAKAAGTATIIVSTTDGSYTATCEVTVPTILVTGVTLKSTTSIAIGGTEQLTATILPTNATNKAVTWSSSNTNVATVVNGLVTAVSAGTATITVTTEDGDKTDICVVTVNAVYTVTFNSRGGSSVPAQNVAQGDLLTPPTPPTREGYAFAGWFYEVDCRNEWFFNSEVVIGDIMLYAKWTEATAIETTEADKLAIYPNPASHDLFIKSDTPIEKVEIFDISGRTVETWRAASLQIQNGVSEKINVSRLNNGIYLVRVFLGDGSAVVKKVVVKQ